MKAKEFMTRDYVRVVKKDIDMVSQVRSIYGPFGFLDVEGILTSFGEEEIFPIPLTKEILEKNGFKQYNEKLGDQIIEGSWSVYDRNINVCEIYESKDGWDLTINNGEYTICKCPHVHTLQHALRLYGFSDLADNFKV